MMVAVAALVFLLEFFQEIPGERQVEFVSLAAVADVHARLIVHSSVPGFFAKIFRRLLFQSSELFRQLSVRNFARDAPQDGSGIILYDVADQNAESGKRAGEGGHDYVRDAESFGKGTCVEASGAAESDEREVAGIAAALDGDHAHGFFHGGVDHADYARGELLKSQQALLPLQPFPSNAAGAVEVESELSTEKMRRLQAGS